MRHRKKLNHLGRKSQHRQAMLSNMAASLILHKRIFTTVAKAKALKVYVEPLITKCKIDSTHSRRVVFSYLSNKFAVSELFREISQKIADRPGGYTRILKTGFRQGDGAEMCMIELVDYNPNFTSKASENQGKKTRRAGRRKKSDAAVAAVAATTVAQDTVNEDKLAETDSPAEEEVNAEEPIAEDITEKVESEIKIEVEDPKPQPPVEELPLQSEETDISELEADPKSEDTKEEDKK
jgi:large subunit ribosomal protein L17